MRKLIFIVSLFLLTGSLLTSCNKDKEETINSKEMQLRTSEFDHTEYINNLREENRESLDAFNADGFVLTFENGDNGDLKETHPELTVADNENGSWFHDNQLDGDGKSCFKDAYGSEEDFNLAMEDCDLCKWFYFSCASQIADYHSMATQIFKLRWKKYLEESKGSPLPNWVKEAVINVFWEVSYADARKYILQTNCNCEE